MNWSDEKYVKLYVRQTATWRMWPWQARAVLPLLLQVANGAGLIDVGGKDPLTGLSVLIMMPREVVEPAIAALLEDGTLERVGTGYLIPKYLEAQEATKTDARKKSDQRDRERAKARGIVEQPVTECHPVSPVVPLQPSPAQPSPTTSPKKHVRAAPAAEVEALKAAWNELTTAPIARWQAGREVTAAAALKRRPLEQWREVFTRINASSFCRGADGGWVADIDWALRAEGKKPETALKVLEGAFDRGARGPPGNARAPAPIGDWNNATHGEIPA